MEELTRPYNKAFPLIIPLILDSFMGSGGYANANTKYAHIHSWAMTAEGEGIGKGAVNVLS